MSVAAYVLYVCVSSGWAYAKHRIINSTGTVGTVAVGDMTADGIADLAVPLYAENKLALYTFAPPSQ